MNRRVIPIAFAFLLAACISGGEGASSTAPLSTGQDETVTKPPETSPADTSLRQPLGLAIVDLDGNVRRELPRLPADAWMPDLSADGAQIVFLTYTLIGGCGYCATTDRLAAVTVGNSSGGFIGSFIGYRDYEGRIDEIEEPVWSPDGSQIAFVGVGRNGDRDIYVADLPHTHMPGLIGLQRQRRLTFDPAVDEFPAWSPDGSTIFYDNGGAQPLDDSGFSPTQEIWSVPVDGGAPKRLTNNKVADVQADVATDGTVAFRREDEIWTMDQDGGNQERLKPVPSGAGLFNPRWSPDGTMMALLRYDPAERALFNYPRHDRPTDLPLLDVVVVDLVTGDITTIGPRVASDGNPVSWTPDGSALLINRYDAGA